MEKSKFLVVGETYEEKSKYKGTGSLFKYVGVVERWDGIKEHEFQCVDFDCDDVFQHYDESTSDEIFKDIFWPPVKAA